MNHRGNYAIVFCYYRLKCLINVSLVTGWPFAKVRPALVSSAWILLLISSHHREPIFHIQDNNLTILLFFLLFVLFSPPLLLLFSKLQLLAEPLCFFGGFFLLQDNVLTFSLNRGHTSGSENLIPHHSKVRCPFMEKPVRPSGNQAAKARKPRVQQHVQRM